MTSPEGGIVAIRTRGHQRTSSSDQDDQLQQERGSCV